MCRGVGSQDKNILHLYCGKFRSDKFHSKTKHLEVNHHFIREIVDVGEITTKYVPSKEQLPNIFTKPLTKEDFCKLRYRLGGVEI